MMLAFCLRYRRGSTASRADPRAEDLALGNRLDHRHACRSSSCSSSGARQSTSGFTTRRRGDLEVYVVGKQWMWKMEHPGGQREIDALHVPVGQDGAAGARLPGRHPQLFHSGIPHQARCRPRHNTRRCGSRRPRPARTSSNAPSIAAPQHAHMRGDVVVMEPAAYARWLTEQGVHESLAEQGEALFRAARLQRLPRRRSSTVHAPSLAGLYGSLVHLQDGSARAGRRALHPRLHPAAGSSTVAGYPPIMPDFSGPARRRRTAEADRLHPIPRHDRKRAPMATITADPADQLSDFREHDRAPGC